MHLLTSVSTNTGKPTQLTKNKQTVWSYIYIHIYIPVVKALEHGPGFSCVICGSRFGGGKESNSAVGLGR